MKRSSKRTKRILAVAGLVFAGLLIILLIYGAALHKAGIIFSALFCLMIIPVLIHLFLMLARSQKEENDSAS